MYQCDTCGKLFDKPGMYGMASFDHGLTTFYFCPHCKSRQVYEAYRCDVCGKLCDDRYDMDGLCAECFHKGEMAIGKTLLELYKTKRARDLFLGEANQYACFLKSCVREAAEETDEC